MGYQATMVLISLIAGFVYGVRKSKEVSSPIMKTLTILIPPFGAYMLASLVIGLFFPPE